MTAENPGEGGTTGDCPSPTPIITGMATSKGIDAELAANAEMDLGDGGALTHEAMEKAMLSLAPYSSGPPVRYMGRQETELRLAGKHPVYPPDNETLLPAWRENADAFWAWYTKGRRVR